MKITTENMVWIVLRCHDQHNYSDPGCNGAEPSAVVEAVYSSEADAEKAAAALGAIERGKYGNPDDVKPDRYGYEVYDGDYFEIVPMPVLTSVAPLEA